MTSTYTGPLWVPGHPVAKGSMKCVTPHVEKRPSRLVPDKRADPDGWVAKLPDVLAWKARTVADNPIDDAVELDVTFHLARPKTTAYPAGPVGHGAGDLDKLLRMVGDAVGGSKTNPNRLITDDSRIARIVAEKVWAENGEGAVIELRPYTPRPGLAPGTGLPVNVTVGRESYTVGSISSAKDLPRLLRAVAEQMEARNVA